MRTVMLALLIVLSLSPVGAMAQFLTHVASMTMSDARMYNLYYIPDRQAAPLRLHTSSGKLILPDARSFFRHHPLLTTPRQDALFEATTLRAPRELWRHIIHLPSGRGFNAIALFPNEKDRQNSHGNLFHMAFIRIMPEQPSPRTIPYSITLGPNLPKPGDTVFPVSFTLNFQGNNVIQRLAHAPYCIDTNQMCNFLRPHLVEYQKNQSEDKNRRVLITTLYLLIQF